MHNLLFEIGAALISCAAAVLFAKDVTSPVVPIVVVTSAETVAAVGPQLTVEYSTGKAAVKGSVTFTVGTGLSSLIMRLYRGTSASGTLVATTITYAGFLGVGQPAQYSVSATDVLTNVGTAQYCMTLQQIGATTNGSITNALIETEVLSG